MRKKKSPQPDDLIDWMKRYLKVDRILKTLNAAVDIDQLLWSVEFKRCPAIDLFIKAHDQRIRSGNDAHENDSDDWSSVSIVPYADLVLTERNLRAFIRQAEPSFDSKVIHNPNDAVTVLAAWFDA